MWLGTVPGGVGRPLSILRVLSPGTEAGVLVMATSGGRVATSEMRAFSLYYEELPVIMVDGSDAARGRLFSLLHEYVHLLLHTSGLCDTITDTRATDPGSTSLAG